MTAELDVVERERGAARVSDGAETDPELRAIQGERRPPAASAPEAPVRPASIPAAATPDEEERAPFNALAWGLATALAIAGLLLAYQYQVGRELGREVDVLQSELADSRAEIEAHQQRMEAVRAHVDDLAVRLGALRELVAQHPDTPEPTGEPVAKPTGEPTGK